MRRLTRLTGFVVSTFLATSAHAVGWSSATGEVAYSDSEIPGEDFGRVFVHAPGSPPSLLWERAPGTETTINRVRVTSNGQRISFIEQGGWLDGGFATRPFVAGDPWDPHRVLRVLTRSGAEELVIDGVGHYEWSPDGRFLAYTQGTEQTEGHGLLTAGVTRVRDMDSNEDEIVLSDAYGAIFWETSESFLMETLALDHRVTRVARDGTGQWSTSPGPRAACSSPTGKYFVQLGPDAFCEVWTAEGDHDLATSLTAFNSRLSSDVQYESTWWPAESFLATRGSERTGAAVGYLIDLENDRLVKISRYLLFAGDETILAIDESGNIVSESLWSFVGEAAQGIPLPWGAVLLDKRDEAELVAHTLPDVLRCGEDYEVSVTYRNIGTSTWTAEEEYELRFWFSSPGDTSRNTSALAFEQSVAPGQTVSAVANFASPPVTTTLRVATAVASGAAWFRRDYVTAQVTCGESGAPPLPEPPEAASEPQPLVLAAGLTATFDYSVVGTDPVQYRWRRDGVGLSNDPRISGVYTPNLTINDVGPADSGHYTCRASNEFGEVISASAELVVGVAPSLTEGPVPRSASEGSSVSLSCLVAGTEPLTYSWLKDGQVVADGGQVTGASTQALMLTNVAASDSGQYSCRVANDWGEAISAQALVSVGSAPIVTTSPASVSTLVGTSATFFLLGLGLGAARLPMVAEWRRAGGRRPSDGLSDSERDGVESGHVRCRRVFLPGGERLWRGRVGLGESRYRKPAAGDEPAGPGDGDRRRRGELLVRGDGRWHPLVSVAERRRGSGR